MSLIDDVRQVVQDLIAPDLKAIKTQMEANQREVMLRFENMNLRFDQLQNQLALDQRLQNVERELKSKKEGVQ